jgi:hypothetical protein
MRGLGGLSLILLALLAGLIWAVTWGPLRDMPLFRAQTSSTVQPATPPPGPAEQSPSTPKVQRKSGSPKEIGRNVPAASMAATSEQVPAAAVPPSAPLPPPKFPTAVDVPIGTLGSSLLDSFGPPIARTLAVNGDGRVEILIYRRSRPDTTTLIQVRNGRVISAVTTAY